jgi:hypothetical protein
MKYIFLLKNIFYQIQSLVDSTGEKRYTAHFNFDQIDQKLYSILNSKI